MSNVLVVFVDALGPTQLTKLSTYLSFPHERRALEGTLGYSSGALATILTGTSPREHGRMCLFSRASSDEGLLRPLELLGLLPRIVHERGFVRRQTARAFAALRGLTGYVALHRVPPAAFAWLDMPERDDLFTANEIGGQATFLARARDEGLRVHAARWALPERERFAELEARAAKDGADLVFAYAAGLDGVLHADGNDGPREGATLRAIADHIEILRSSMRRNGHVKTIVMGDHGMANVQRIINPGSVIEKLTTPRFFVDSTMLRVWGTPSELGRARLAVERAKWPAKWLDTAELVAREAPVEGAPYGDAIALMDEGALLAPSYVGGAARGMHGYDVGSASSIAALATDMPLDGAIRGTRDVAPAIQRALGLS